MTDVRTPEDLARRQGGVVARWQLIRAGLSERSAECRVRGLQSVGRRRVPDRAGAADAACSGGGPPSSARLGPCSATRAPRRAGHQARRRPGIVTVARVGTRGREHSRGLHVSYSLTLRGQVTESDGLPITTVERTIIDLWPHLSPPRPRADAPRGAAAAADLDATHAGGDPCPSRPPWGRVLRVEVASSAASARPLQVGRGGIRRRPHRRRRGSMPDVNARDRRERGRPQLAGAPTHHRARRPRLPCAS